MVNYTRINFKMFIVISVIIRLQHIKVKFKELVQPTTGHTGSMCKVNYACNTGSTHIFICVSASYHTLVNLLSDKTVKNI